MLTLQIVVVACVVIVLFYYKQIYQVFIQRIRLYRAMAMFEGPLALPIIGSAWMFKWDLGDLSKQLLQLGRYYAKKGNGFVAVWIGPRPLVAVVHPEYVKAVLESNEVITKSVEYNLIRAWLNSGLLTSTGDKWRRRRKMLTPTFHFKMLNSFLTVHDYQAKVLIEQLQPLADGGQEFDLFPFLKRAALDIICETAMGMTVDAQRNHVHPYVVSVQEVTELIMLWIRMPWLRPKVFWYLSGKGYLFDKHLRVVTGFTRKVIHERWEEYELYDDDAGKKKKKAFLDLLLEMHRQGDMTLEDVREEVDTFMFEGHDTTSSSLGWTIWSVAHHLDVQTKIKNELEAVFGTSDRDCTSDDLKQLKYLEQCIKESLRMFPPVPFFARTVDDDIEIKGTLVPKGASIAVIPILLHRNDQFWNDPDHYNPDNYSEEAKQQRHPFLDVPFSAGPRNCIGQKFALMEEKTVLSWFFRKFSVSATLPFADNDPLPGIILKPRCGFPVTIRPRVRT